MVSEHSELLNILAGGTYSYHEATATVFRLEQRRRLPFIVMSVILMAQSAEWGPR